MCFSVYVDSQGDRKMDHAGLKTLWRISGFLELSGEGGLSASGRWHTEEQLIVYLADCPAGALVERIVHMTDMVEDAFLPRFYQLLKVSVPDELSIRSLKELAPTDWKENLEYTRQLGDAWLASRETALARVPSAIAPYTWNYLLNPEHPDAKKVKIVDKLKERFDNRLFRFGAR
jgi:RES domain-containing protein